MIRILYVSIFTLGLALLSINLYGLFFSIGDFEIDSSHLRFNADQIYSYDYTISNLPKGQAESTKNYADRLNLLIASRLAHVDWNFPETNRYQQLIPIWENYFLYFMGLFSGIPEYQRYHFSDYKKSLKRGIGICGDASMVMSQVLSEEGIDNQIISFQGHVILEAYFDDGTRFSYDPDFGVSIPYSILNINESPWKVISHYKEKGYSDREIGGLVRSYGDQYERWEGVSHFITKKYYFERVSYWLKWPFPLFLIFISIWLGKRYIKNML